MNKPAAAPTAQPAKGVPVFDVPRQREQQAEHGAAVSTPGGDPHTLERDLAVEGGDGAEPKPPVQADEAGRRNRFARGFLVGVEAEAGGWVEPPKPSMPVVPSTSPQKPASRTSWVSPGSRSSWFARDDRERRGDETRLPPPRRPCFPRPDDVVGDVRDQQHGRGEIRGDRQRQRQIAAIGIPQLQVGDRAERVGEGARAPPAPRSSRHRRSHWRART